jgi:hypothetical protein
MPAVGADPGTTEAAVAITDNAGTISATTITKARQKEVSLNFFILVLLLFSFLDRNARSLSVAMHTFSMHRRFSHLKKDRFLGHPLPWVDPRTRASAPSCDLYNYFIKNRLGCQHLLAFLFFLAF